MSVLERVYFFHDELIRKRYPNARNLMQEFEISLATARRDIAYLRDRLLAPLAFDQKRNGFYYQEDGFELPFANTPRIIFLLGMLNQLARETGLSGLTEVQQLEQRLSKLVEHDLHHLTESIQFEWIEIEHPDPGVFDMAIEAIVKQQSLTIAYQSPQKDVSERLIVPRKLLNYQGRWYLYSWCTVRQAVRLFHIARIRQAELSGKVAPDNERWPEDLEHASFGIFKGPPKYEARIFFTGLAADLVKFQLWHKEQTIEKHQDGIVLSLPVSDDREIMMKILQYGAQARVLHPPELFNKIKAEAQRMVAAPSPE